MTTAAIARNLAVSADVVRYLLEQFPLVRPTTRRRIRNDPAETRLTKADLLRMYNREGMTLTAIAAEVGVGREAVGDLARKYGIPIRHYYRIGPDILDWLYEEHVVKQRTLTAIAQDVGVSLSALSRAARKYGILVCRDPASGASLLSVHESRLPLCVTSSVTTYRVESRRAAVACTLPITRR